MKLRLLASSLLLAIGFAAFGQSIGLIGTATPGGWGSDTNLVQSPDSAHLWSFNITLAQGEAKFRQDDDWAINWGAADYPAGIGVQGGPNIPIPGGGDYSVSFNSNTGAYNFVHHSDIGIIGSATAGGWNDDTNMFRDAADTNQYYITLDLVVGECKFRQNDAWTVNWGAADYPSGIGVQGGPNVPIAAAGKYVVKFNKSTGAYSFEEKIDFLAIGLIGSATVGGWNTDTDLTKDANNPDLWKADVTLTVGEAKFRANHDWAISWGDTIFPASVGLLGGPNIPVDVAGDYKVTFNTKTAEYKFTLIPVFTSIGIIGNATPGGWAAETGLDQDPADKTIWKKRLKLTDGEAKFRANNDWTINWGFGTFPTGIGEQDGANIPVPAGEYKITFNSLTGEYNFEEIVVFDTIGLIGNAIPGNNWDADVFMTKSPTNEYLFYINSIDLLDAPASGGVKFRANAAWKINWGTLAWPSGIGTQDGHNIEPVAGTYGVTFNTDSGEFTFGNPIIGTENLFTAEAVTLSPNPANDFVNIATDAKELTGDAHIVVFNSLGARVLEQDLTINGSAKLNISTLKTGNYFVHISNGKNMVGKSLVVVR